MVFDRKNLPDEQQDAHNQFNIPVIKQLPEDIISHSSSHRFIGDYVTNHAADDSSFMFQIDHNQFRDRGILQGDYVVAESEGRLNSGDMVVATLGEETFLAAFFPLGHKIRLERDTRGKNILVLDPTITQFSLKGKVVRIIRPIV